VNRIVCGDALTLIPTLPNRTVALALFSPPYAMQRRRQYGGVAEQDYPAWMTAIMAALRPKLTRDGSVLLVIRSHVRDGVVSDYVLRTRLALREDGWKECEELIWWKPDAPPLGSTQRPRRTWENILWFAKTPRPYIDLRAAGTFSDRIGFGGSEGLRNGNHPIATKRPSKLETGQSRTPDHFTALVSENERFRHPSNVSGVFVRKVDPHFQPENRSVFGPVLRQRDDLVSGSEFGQAVRRVRLQSKVREDRNCQVAGETRNSFHFGKHVRTPFAPGLSTASSTTTGILIIERAELIGRADFQSHPGPHRE
jgi:hypothetical protein